MSVSSVGLIGAGAIGRAHAERFMASNILRLAAIADPSPEADTFARGLGCDYFADYAALLDRPDLDGVIVATPNDLHLPVTLAAIRRNLPVLVEKPIAVSVAEGEAMHRAATEAGVPILVGHHRRHNPIIRRARELIASGAIGAITAVSVLAMFRKPDSYFDLKWRREPGGGPVLINLIHEIDLIRHLCGEIVAVEAVTSKARRGFQVEDTAVVLLQLANGGLATVTLSDVAVSPFAWDLMSGELASYPTPVKRVDTHFITGSEGALALPSLDLWTYPQEKSWALPLEYRPQTVEPADPYLAQFAHFARVIRGEEPSLLPADDGTRTLRATLAVHVSAREGRIVALE